MFKITGTGGGSWLLYDAFDTDIDPLTDPHTAEPGPGPWAVVNASGAFKTAGGVLSINGTPAATDGLAAFSKTVPIERQPGLAFFCKSVTRTTPADARMGWMDDAITNDPLANMNTTSGVDIVSSTNTAVKYGASSVRSSFSTGAAGTVHEYIVALRGQGAIVLTRDGSSGNYVLQWVHREVANNADVYAVIKGTNAATVLTLDDAEISMLGGSFVSDYGLATSRTAIAAANTTGTMTADALVEFSWTPATNDVLNFDVRRVDDSNCIRIKCDQANSTIRLYSVAAGVETALAAAAAKTWTVGTAYRIIAYCLANVTTATVDITFATNASTALYNTATTYKVDLAGVELIAWPHLIGSSLVTRVSGTLLASGREWLAETASFMAACIPSANKTVVFIGGSNTAGVGASNANTTSFSALVSAWLTARYPSTNFTFINSGVGGTDSWYGLIRLQADLIANSPNLVIFDFAINDSTSAWDQPSAEALIRRIRTSLPNCALMCTFQLQVTAVPGTDATNLKDSVKRWWRRMCTTYHMPFADYAATIKTRVTAGENLSVYCYDTAHPNDTGHALVASLIENILAASATDEAVDWASHLAIIGPDNSSAANYQNTPIARTGVDNDAETGTGWSTSGTARISSTANDTIAWTGTFQSFGWDTIVGAGAGVLQWKLDAGAYSANVDLSAVGVTNQPISTTTRAAHTVTLKVISGTVTINRFLAI